MDQRPQCDRTYLPQPATTVEMYLSALLDVAVEIRDDLKRQAPTPPAAPDGQVALREPTRDPRPGPVRSQRQRG